MDWTNFRNMDPDLLVGIVNTAIRDHHGSFQELCSSEDIDPQELKDKLAEGDYEYFESAHQFR